MRIILLLNSQQKKTERFRFDTDVKGNAKYLLSLLKKSDILIRDSASLSGNNNAEVIYVLELYYNDLYLYGAVDDELNSTKDCKDLFSYLKSIAFKKETLREIPDAKTT